jgi:hypothetical protein
MRIKILIILCLLCSPCLFAEVLFQSNFDNEGTWTAQQSSSTPSSCYENCDFDTGWTAYNQGPSQCPAGVTNDPGYNSLYINAIPGYPAESTGTDRSGNGKALTKWMEACDSGDAFDDSDANLGVDFGSEKPDVYLRFYIKFPANFYTTNNFSFKLWHIQHYLPDDSCCTVAEDYPNGASCSSSANPWSYFNYCLPNNWNRIATAGGIRTFDDGNEGGTVYVDIYAEARGNTLPEAHNFIFWRLGTLTEMKASGVFDGNWHSITVRAKANTSINTTDGEMNVWFDGVRKTTWGEYPENGIDWNNSLNGANTDVRGFRFVSISGNNMKWTTECSDGEGDMSNCEQWYSIDDVVIATTYADLDGETEPATNAISGMTFNGMVKQ